MATAPTAATIWSSNGGQALIPVTIKGVSSGGGGSGGGSTGGGGGDGVKTASSKKIAVSKTGKGPAGGSFAPGTVVTLTATPDAGSPWIGWTGTAATKRTR